MGYDKNVTYDLKVSGTLIAGDSQYFLVEDNQMKFRVKMLPFQYGKPSPETVKCVVYGFDADESPLFVQSIPELVKRLYTIGDTYPFVVGKKQNLTTTHRNSYSGYDTNGFRAVIMAGMGNLLLAGRTVDCVLKHIDSEGLLTVEPACKAFVQESNFLTFQQLMRNLRMEPPFESLTLDALKAEPNKDKKLTQLLEEYEGHVGAWIFSYLFILQSKMEEAIDRNEPEKVCALVRYRQAMEEWMLEDSLFLSFYSPEVVETLRNKGERELMRGEALIKAVALVQNNEAETFLQKTFSKMHASGYLLDKSRKIALVVALFRVDTALWERNLAALAEFCRHLATDTDADDYSLLSVIELIRRYIDKKDWRETRYDRKIHLLALYLLLCKDRENAQLAVYRSMLYRYCCLVSPESTRIFANKAFDELTSEENIRKPEFGWNDVVQFKVEFFVTKLRVFMTDNGTDNGLRQAAAQLLTPNGRVLLQNNTFTIYAGSSFNKLMDYQKPVEILSLLDGRLRIMAAKELKPKMTERENIVPLKKIWMKLPEMFLKKVPEKQEETIIKTLPVVGTRVTVRLSPLNPRFPLMLFAEIVDPSFEGKGVLIVNEVCRYHISTFNGVFFEGDTFDVTVVKVDEKGKMVFSIFQELFDMVVSMIKPGFRICAKLNKVSKGACIWVSEKGYSVFTPAVAPYHEVGETALLEVDNINEKGYINATVVEAVDMQIYEEQALAALVSEYISYCRPEDDSDEEENDLESVSAGETAVVEKQLTLPLLSELSELLIVSSTVGNSVTDRYNLLGSALLAACFTGNVTGQEYISLLMNYEENIYSFATHTGQAYWVDNLLIDDEAAARFPSLVPLRERIRILKQFGSHTFDPHLAVGIATTKDENKEHIIRLVLANGLLYHTLGSDELLLLRNELLKRIGASEFVEPVRVVKEGNEEEKIEVVNLGRESGEVEFKSSIVYPASRSTPDMKQQSEVILRTITGFLNAEGGILYIGVADNGNVNGLMNDFSYMACDSDAYERFIRQRIISTLGKDINSTIHIDFPKYGEREICRVTVPCYGKLVELNGAVWQRQGNSTILLDGNALLKQQQRKKTLSKNEPETPDTESEAEQQKKKKGKAKQLAKDKNRIPTSSLRLNLLTRGEVEEGQEIYAYLSLLENGAYMLTDELSYSDLALLTLAIGVNEVGGNLLLCYDNGCVNRIPLKVLLQKKRRYAYKNGVNKDARLMFATIENGESYILCCTNKQGGDYYKLFTMEKIKQNVDLTTKGTPLFSYDFGEVTRWEVIPQSEAEKLKKLVCDKLQYQGVAIHAETIAAEREALRALGL